jgi:hypothetical protein
MSANHAKNDRCTCLPDTVTRLRQRHIAVTDPQNKNGAPSKMTKRTPPRRAVTPMRSDLYNDFSVLRRSRGCTLRCIPGYHRDPDIHGGIDLNHGSRPRREQQHQARYYPPPPHRVRQIDTIGYPENNKTKPFCCNWPVDNKLQGLFQIRLCAGNKKKCRQAISPNGTCGTLYQ